jgi:hypothetical protein
VAGEYRSLRLLCADPMSVAPSSPPPPLFTLARPHGLLEASGVLGSRSLLSYAASHTYSVRTNVVGALGPVLMSATHTP